MQQNGLLTWKQEIEGKRCYKDREICSQVNSKAHQNYLQFSLGGGRGDFNMLEFLFSEELTA